MISAFVDFSLQIYHSMPYSFVIPFLCLLRCKFWLESGAVQSYNNRIKSDRLSSDNERRVVCIILRKLLLTTQQTTYRFGALRNSGDKSAEEHGFPSGKGRKKLFLAEIALIGPFGSKMLQVRVLSLRPNFDRKQILFSAFGHFYAYLRILPPLLKKSHFYDHIRRQGIRA